MIDYLKRIGIVIVMALCISILFLTGIVVNAEENINQYIKEEWVIPIEGDITDHFGSRGGHHKGIDISTEKDAKVMTVENGTVSRSYYSSSYGNVVFINHGGQYETVYAHLSKRSVSEGEKVSKGQVIGIVGSTGNSTGIHLHFEIHNKEWTMDKQNAIDPLFVFEQNNHRDDDQVVQASKMEETERQFVVKVEKGDTLWAISRKYQVTVDELMEWNSLKSDLIYPKQELQINGEVVERTLEDRKKDSEDLRANKQKN
ncbi:peptidoglycan DD-metalloendopeptidase family protein [Bacillus carboniphilus]|uniref:Peptidoglycan DD-metalloendopeptidase family protein n=1 Tax=Bacillus carboniphilus TaxID=86663 RepID=A0ABY9JYZ0_9BACI|nr:peptidoglycan DD-metalloendopeptidase family protein [Bacillus carboniphilus]WLR43772.1 peptidoglycan DD-metalloendopeptidase family protein [Bacillus carboniphilus]